MNTTSDSTVVLLRLLKIALPCAAAWLLCFTDAFHRLTRITVVLILERVWKLEAVQLNSTMFAVSCNAYEIIFWCTPAVILIAGYSVIGLSTATLPRYVARCVLFTLFVHTMVTFGLAFSIWLHQMGWSWSAAHYPVYVFVNATCLSVCLIRSSSSARTSSSPA